MVYIIGIALKSAVSFFMQADTLQAITAFSTLGLLVATCLLVLHTWRSVSVVVKQFRLQSSPALNVYACRDNESLWIVVENTGRATCHNIILSVDPPLKSQTGTDVDLGFFKTGVPSLGPGQDVRVMWDWDPSRRRFAERIDESLHHSVVASGSEGSDLEQTIFAESKISMALFSKHAGMKSTNSDSDQLAREFKGVARSLSQIANQNDKITKSLNSTSRFR